MGAPSYPFMVSLSNHERAALRQAQGQRILELLEDSASPYCATQPPSITSSLPVMNEASSDARYSTP